MSIQEMLFKTLSAQELLKLNLSLGNLNSNSNGLLIKIMMFLLVNFVDSHGKQTIKNSKPSSKLLIGSDSIPMSMSVIH